MAKVSSIQKNINRKVKVSSLKNKRSALKEKIYDKNLSLEERYDLIIKLSELPRNSSKIRLRNRCELTGRPRGFYSKFKLSRIKLRELAAIGQIPGLIKASW